MGGSRRTVPRYLLVCALKLNFCFVRIILIHRQNLRRELWAVSGNPFAVRTISVYARWDLVWRGE